MEARAGMRVVRSLNFACVILIAAASIVPIGARSADRWFSIRGKSDFADVRAQLQVVVDEHAHHRTSKFCVTGETAGDSARAWVYWPDENKLILWRPDQDNPHAIAGSNRYLDLKRDVVEGNDVHGSTYKLTRASANSVIRACKQHGDIYTIARPQTVAHSADVERQAPQNWLANPSLERKDDL